MGASCFAQTNALFRKNLVIQRRDCKTNCCLICFPLLVCLLLGVGQIAVTVFYLRSVVGNGPQMDCGYCAANTDPSFVKDTLGGLDCTTRCPLPFAPKWPPVLQLPVPGITEIEIGGGVSQTSDLQGSSISDLTFSAATFLVTGSNQSFAERVMSNMFPKLDSPNFTADISTLSDFTLGANAMRFLSLGADELSSDLFGHLYFLQDNCTANSTLSFPVQEGSRNFIKDAECTEGLFLWRENLSVMNKELYRGYNQDNNETNNIVSAYDFTSSDLHKFNLIVSYNPIYKGPDHVPLLLIPLPPILLRIPRLLNLASNAYLKLRSNDTKMRFEFVKDMPRPAQLVTPPDVSSELGKLPFVWIITLLFPVILSNLVYEKQQKLRAMMKMHGLGDMSYWTITYSYFLIISLLYVLLLVLFGSIVDLKLFRLNDYRVQFIVYFVYINLQISFAFLVATYFSNVRIATIAGYVFTIGSGFLGEFLFRPVFEDISLSGRWITLMEFFPPFSLYRIIYEFSPPPAFMYRTDFAGMQWKDFSDSKSGMIDMLLIMVLEWIMFLFVTLYLDEFGSLRNGIKKLAVVCRSCLGGSSQASQRQAVHLQEFKASVETGREDVFREREIVEQLLQESDSSYSVICNNIMKVYSGKDGNAAKIAINRLYLYTQRGQCLGILGPNGAGKTTLIGMLTGFTKPTSGTAYINGMDIRLDMDKIYTGIGVCPQFDLLWETLTGREHLIFYGRLKNLSGATLDEAVEESLKNVRLFDGGVADKHVAKYSGGMKRRLSVAISLIGDPKVVYMDEPSSGLDPASRKALWNAVQSAKQDRAIILTTHSMEEAEALCDRIAIVTNGSLQCIGDSKELKARYGGTYVLTVTAAEGEEEAVERLVQSISPAVKKTYRISGTQKFEMSKQRLRISEVFAAMEHAKRRLNIHAWGLSDTTLEDVFIKVAEESELSNV